MDERLKQLMLELGVAINDSLTYSERIASAIGEIHEAGFNIFLILEATIGFGPRDADKGENGDSAEIGGSSQPHVRLKLTTQDEKFLRALKISFKPNGEK